MGITFDASFVIDVIRRERAAVAKAKELQTSREVQVLTAPVLYEVSTGLLFTRSRSDAAAFRGFAARFSVLPFDEAAAMKAAEIQAELMRRGTAKAHIDVMIAGIAAQGGHTLVTRDADFASIGTVVGLPVEPY